MFFENIMDAGLDILYQTTEYREYAQHGWSWLTIGALGAFIILVPELLALGSQIHKIWSERSVESLSTSWVSYTACFMGACIPYGLEKASAAIVVSAACFGIMHLPLLWGIRKFRGFREEEVRDTCIFFLMIPAMAQPLEVTYLLFSLGLIYAYWLQLATLMREKRPGVLDPKLFLIYLLAFGFWAIYGFAINALALMILNPVMFALCGAILWLWFKYRRNQVPALAQA